MKNAVVKREPAPVEVVGGNVDFGEVLADDFKGSYDGKVAARVKAHLAAATLFSRLSLAHAIAAGWLLYIQKIHTPYGEWQNWCRKELGVAHKTADRYIGLFRRTVGAAREKDGTPFENSVTERELEFATFGMEDKSATAVMVELGIVKRDPNRGGPREGAGRPAKDPAAEAVAAAADPDLSWAEASGYLRDLYRFGVEEDEFGSLADDDLESLSVMLAALTKRAEELLAARRGNGGRA